jgi:hypothetical protein
MVPSWTETLLYCGVDVVGRTRFCVHPRDATRSIPVVGGTKDWTWSRVVEARPDLILLDQEENPKLMSEQNSIPWHSTHVTRIDDLPSTIEALATVLQNEKLREVAHRWRTIRDLTPLPPPEDWDKLPGLIKWGAKPRQKPKRILYMIWKDPWMCVSRETFIGSVLHAVGIETPEFSKKYPEIPLSDYRPEETLLLLSSEPYPFLKKGPDFAAGSRFPHAFVQGENFSWFGIRSLQFLERLHHRPDTIKE